MSDIFYNMDSEKILFCYRDDEINRPTVYGPADEMRIVAAIPCCRHWPGKVMPIEQRLFGEKLFLQSQRQVKKSIAGIYEKSGAGYLWLDESLCDFLQMEKMDLPEILLEKWLDGIPFFHTLILADDRRGRALEAIYGRMDKLAAVCVVCYEKNISDYEAAAVKLFQNEGIVLQIFTYEMLNGNPEFLWDNLVIKGRAAVLDLDEKYSFWDKRLLRDIGYYSFWKEIRLFLDTFQKNRYNTLTK